MDYNPQTVLPQSGTLCKLHMISCYLINPHMYLLYIKPTNRFCLYKKNSAWLLNLVFLQKKERHFVNKILRPNEHFTEGSSNIVNIGVIAYDDPTWFFVLLIIPCTRAEKGSWQQQPNYILMLRLCR